MDVNSKLQTETWGVSHDAVVAVIYPCSLEVRCSVSHIGEIKGDRTLTREITPSFSHAINGDHEDALKSVLDKLYLITPQPDCIIIAMTGKPKHSRPSKNGVVCGSTFILAPGTEEPGWEGFDSIRFVSRYWCDLAKRQAVRETLPRFLYISADNAACVSESSTRPNQNWAVIQACSRSTISNIMRNGVITEESKCSSDTILPAIHMGNGEDDGFAARYFPDDGMKETDATFNNWTNAKAVENRFFELESVRRPIREIESTHAAFEACTGYIGQLILRLGIAHPKLSGVTVYGLCASGADRRTHEVQFLKNVRSAFAASHAHLPGGALKRRISLIDPHQFINGRNHEQLVSHGALLAASDLLFTG